MTILYYAGVIAGAVFISVAMSICFDVDPDSFIGYLIPAVAAAALLYALKI